MSNPTKWLAALFAFAALSGPALAAPVPTTVDQVDVNGTLVDSFSSGAAYTGTRADSPVSNSANVTYDIGSSSFGSPSNTVTFNVDEKIQALVTAINSPVSVEPDQQNAILAYRLTNLGNGQEPFVIGLNPDVIESGTTTTLPGNFFNPDNLDRLYLAGADDVCGATDQIPANEVLPGAIVTLDPGEDLLLCAFGDIPDVQTPNDEADVLVSATSNTPGASAAGAGESIGAVGDNGVNAIVIEAGGVNEGIGTYVVVGVTVTIVKSIVSIDDTAVLDPPFEDAVNGAAIPGATITYQLLVSVIGAGTAEGLVVTDALALPDVTPGGSGGTSYVPNTTNVNGGVIPDGTTVGGVTVTTSIVGTDLVLAIAFGSVPGAATPGNQQNISFQVVIE